MKMLSRPLSPLALGLIAALLVVLTALYLLVAFGVLSPFGVAGVTAAAPVPVAALSTPIATSQPHANATERLASSRSPTPPAPSETPTHQPTPSPEPTATPQPQATNTPSPPVPTPSAWLRIHIPDQGLGLDVPAGWQQIGESWAWQPRPGSRVGVGWAEAESVEDGLVLLPAPSRIYYQEALSAGWAEGISYWIELEENEPNIERHILLAAGDGLVFDFYASAPSQPELAHLEPVLVRMFSSITRATTIGGPVDISVQFLSALLRDPAGDEAAIFLDQPLQDRVQAGDTYQSLLDLQAGFNAFTVARLPQTDSSVHIQALLGLPAGSVKERILVLVQQGYEWRITEILHPAQP